MIPVYFDPANVLDPVDKLWLEQWAMRAETAIKAAIEDFERWLSGPRDAPYRFNAQAAIWGDYKQWLLDNVFHDKCAYCETTLTRAPFDAEHYRPKGAVTYQDQQNAIVKARFDAVNPGTNQAISIPHPGYFWLAYDWRNLVPSCPDCNSGHGKNQRFDVRQAHHLLVPLTDQEVQALPADQQPRPSQTWPGYYYLAPSALDVCEDPLILFPLNPVAGRNPRELLRFGVKGTISPLKGSELAERTIAIFNLKDDKLRRARQKEQEGFLRELTQALGIINAHAKSPKAIALVEAYTRGEHPFSAAVVDFYKLWCKAIP